MSLDRLLQFALSNAIAAMLLAFVAAATSHLLRRPPLTRAVWILVLLKLVTPPLWSIPVSFFARSTPIQTYPNTTPTLLASNVIDQQPLNDSIDMQSPVEASQNIDEPDSLDIPIVQTLATPAPSALSGTFQPFTTSQLAVLLKAHISQILCIFWVTGALIYAAIILRSTARISRLFAQSIPAPLAIRKRALELSRAMGVGRCPEVVFVRGALPPMLCAIGFRPRIILPASLWTRLEDSQKDTVLVHELAHLRHGDHWVRRLELMAAVLYWWHPAVWWSRSQLRESSEQCCDAWVVWTLPRLARDYAAALIETIDFISLARPSLPVLASGMGQFTDLRRRLVMINQGSARRALTAPAFAAVCSLAGILLPLAPSFAQEAPPAPPVPAARPAIIAPPAPIEPLAPLPPAEVDAPKANILIAPSPRPLRETEEQESADRPRNNAEIERARGEVNKLREQLRNAERHLNDLQRNTVRDEVQKERAKAMAEAQKERAKAMATAQKERAKAMEQVARDRQRADQDRRNAERDRANAQRDRENAMRDLANAKRDNQNANDENSPPKPRADSQNRGVRVTVRRNNNINQNDEVVKAGERIRASSANDQNSRDAMERRLDQMEKQLTEMVDQLRQMRRTSNDSTRRGGNPSPSPSPKANPNRDFQE